MMNYHGYIGHVEYDDEQHIFTGSVINTRDVITFQGETVQELEKAFRDSVDDYLAWCREDGIEPESPTQEDSMYVLILRFISELRLRRKNRGYLSIDW